MGWQANPVKPSIHRLLVGLAVALVLLLSAVWVQGRTVDWAQTPAVAENELPVQAQQVLAQIRAGGPFRYQKDGAVFGNRERLLPLQKRGFYRQYTVPTPGERDRGARRIVCGGLQPQRPDACFYTKDHYNSFRLIVP